MLRSNASLRRYSKIVTMIVIGNASRLVVQHATVNEAYYLISPAVERALFMSGITRLGNRPCVVGFTTTDSVSIPHRTIGVIIVVRVSRAILCDSQDMALFIFQEHW
jgi:hypothetical protein